MKTVIGICIICSSACAAVATLATPSIAGGTSGASSSINFTVSAPESPLNVLVVMLPSGLKFDSKNQFKIISQSPTNVNLIQDFDYYPDNDNNNPNAKYPIGSAYSACKAAGAQCLIVEFNPPGFGPNDALTFSQGVLSGKVPATLQQLAGANITFGLNPPSSAGSTTTSQFIATSELMYNGTTATASSQTTSNILPPPVVMNPQPLGPPCTPFWDANGNPSCKFDYIVVDGDPSTEGGQP